MSSRDYKSFRGICVWPEAVITRYIHCIIKGIPWTPDMQVDPGENPVLLRKAEVLRRTGLSYQTIWNLEKTGRFPRHSYLPTVNESYQRRMAAAALAEAS